MPFPAFSTGHFQQIKTQENAGKRRKTQENAVVSCLFYSSLVLSVRYGFTGIKGPVTKSELWNIVLKG